MIAYVRTVNAMAEKGRPSQPVQKADLRCGDRVLVATRSSVYSIEVPDDSACTIRGGCFRSMARVI